MCKRERKKEKNKKKEGTIVNEIRTQWPNNGMNDGENDRRFGCYC